MAAEDPTPPDVAPQPAPGGGESGRGEPTGPESGPGAPAAGPGGSAGTGHAGQADDDLQGHLIDEPTTADLRAKVTEAWRDFARALARAVPRLTAGASLVLTLDPTATGTGDAEYSVTLQAANGGEVTAFAVGNAALPPEYRMDRAAVAHLVALGWSPPGVVEGSKDRFGLRAPATDASRLAATVTRTMREIYGTPHPAFLVYRVHDEHDQPMAVEPLGTARAETVDEEQLTAALDELDRAPQSPRSRVLDEAVPLADRVRMVVAAMQKTEVDQLQVDGDGDVSIRAGSAMVFVRVRDTPPLVDVFSPVLTEIEPTEHLYVRLSELTSRMPIGRLYCTNDTVWASVPVFGRNFQPTHLMLAVQVMTGLADELDDRLHGEFGGKRFFGEADKGGRRDDEEHRTGMYL